MILTAMSTAPATRVSVVVPARGATRTVARAIRSALRQPEVDEVVVAAGDVETRRAAEEVDDARVKIVDNPDGATPTALNLAIGHSSGDVIVRCDAHATLPPGYVARALATLERTGAANVGGRQVAKGQTTFERAVAMAMRSPVGAGDARYRIGGREGAADTVYLGAFRREALEEVGGYDETLERNQDYELNWRLRRQGRLVWFDPALAVEYRPRSSPFRLWRQYFEYGYWKVVVLRRHPGSLRARQMAAPLLVAGLTGSLLLAPVAPRWASAVPGVYLATTLGAAAWDGVRTGDPAAALETPVLWIMHVAWGTGFIAGLLSGRR